MESDELRLLRDEVDRLRRVARLARAVLDRLADPYDDAWRDQRLVPYKVAADMVIELDVVLGRPRR